MDPSFRQLPQRRDACVRRLRLRKRLSTLQSGQRRLYLPHLLAEARIVADGLIREMAWQQHLLQEFQQWSSDGAQAIDVGLNAELQGAGQVG